MKSRYLSVNLFIILLVIFLAGCAGAGGAFKAAKEKNTIGAYDQFLREYGDSEFAPQAKKLKEDIRFKETKEGNTLSAYDEYLKEYPNGAFVSEVNKLRGNVRFNESKELNTLSAYAEYLTEYPNGIFVSEVNKLIEQLKYNQAIKLNTYKEYAAYLEEFPSGRHADELRKNLPYIISKRIFELALNMWTGALRSGGPSGFTAVYNRSPEWATQMKEFRRLLKNGADPTLFRISRFVPPHLQKISDRMSYTKFGNKGGIVPAVKGGMTLLEYLETTMQSEALDLLKAHEKK